MVEKEDIRSWHRLWELIWGCAIGQAIHVAIELGLPELLDARPLSSDDLATATSSDAWALEAVLRCLTAFEVVQVDEEQRFVLTTIGRLLVKSSSGSFAGEAGAFFDSIYRPLGALKHMVRTGEVAFDHIYGVSFYEHLTQNPELEACFYGIMTSSVRSRYAGLSSVYDFSRAARVIDVGGGEGGLLLQILREHPSVTGVLFDVAGGIDHARTRIEADGITDRCELIAGDFFESVPAGCDVYVLAQILNNWRDDDARRILLNCRVAMGENARLLVLEPVHVSNAPILPSRALISLAVMAQRGGRTRSESQLRALFESAQFRIDAIRQLPFSTTCAIAASPLKERTTPHH